MRILVTGASGFSGSFVAADLARRGHEVVGLHRHATLFLDRLRQMAPSARLVRSTLADAGQLAGPFDAIIHTAATSPAPGVDDAQLIRDNREGTKALVEAAGASGCRAFVYFSSLSIYGEIAVPVLDERTPITQPNTYGATKYDGERYLAACADRVPGLALRLPGVIGWGARRNWLAGVGANLRAGKPIRAFHLDAVFNNAAHIADIAALVAHCVERDWQGFDAVVLGAGGAITVRGAIERLAAGLGVPAQVEAIPAPKPGFTLSSRRAMEHWGYAPMEIGAMIDRYASELRTEPMTA
jgi:nucleoside-diphosphate-sugar epimerase